MAHTLPDYSSKWRNETIFGVADMGELAARLNSIDKFDRRGNVIWMDDFEGATNLWTLNGGAGYATALNAAVALAGSQSMKMTTGGIGGNNWAIIYRTLAYPVLSNIGFEISSSWDDDVLYFYWQIFLWTGTTLMDPSIRYNDTTHELLYLDAANVYQVFATNVDMDLNANSFNTCKLVIDFVNGYYQRFIFNNVTYDLSAYPCRQAASATRARLRVLFSQYADGVTTPSIYADNAIVTQNEEAQ